MLRDGDCVLRDIDGGLKRLWGFKRLERRRVGERPAAAAGAEAGAIEAGLTKVSRRGVDMAGLSRRGLKEVEVTFKLYRWVLEAETSSSKADRLRLFNESRMFGSTFSLSEPISGETARRLRDGAELGVSATTARSVSIV